MPRRGLLFGAAALSLLAWAGALRAGAPPGLLVTFFDVGQGDAALVRSAEGAAILIDGGPDPQQVAVELAALGVKRLDLVVATHPHADHVGGLPSVLAKFHVGLVIDPGCEGDSPFYDHFRRAVRAADVPVRHPAVGSVLGVGDVRLEVLGPKHCFVGTDSDANNDSVVLRVSSGSGSASLLFSGDAEEPAQEALLQHVTHLLPATVLKVPHHGGDTSVAEFFAATRARVAVVSTGPNTYGHPAADVLHDLAAVGMRVLRTDRLGDITIRFDPDGLSISWTHP